MPWSPDGYVSGAKPTPERKRQHEQAASVGPVLEGIAELVREHEEARVTRIISEPWTWDIKARRFRYAKGMAGLNTKKGGRSKKLYIGTGGRFAKVGDSPLAERIRKRTEKKRS